MEKQMRSSAMPEFWLVLSGSGMRLYAFLGAILALVSMGVRIKGITATSGGAVVAGVMAKYYDPADPVKSMRKVIKVAKSIKPSNILTFRWRVWEWLLTNLFRKGPKGPFQTGKILKTFREHMPATIGESKFPIRVCSYQVNLKSPVPVTFTEPDVDLPLACLGSMSLPVFDPTKYGVALLQDGGWVRNFNIPDDEVNVIGLYFGGANAGPVSGIVSDKAQLVDIKDNIQLIQKCISGVIDDNMRRSVEEAVEEGVNLVKIPLRTKLETLDFFASETKIDQAIDEGYDSVASTYAFLSKRLSK